MGSTMIEITNVRQIPGEPKRRWFSSRDFDLFVHCAEDGRFTGFQLCYDKPHREHAILYRDGEGFRHMVVDDGEQRPGRYKASPMLVADGVFDAARIYASFIEASASLPAEVADYVRLALARHPGVRSAD
jgi:hypothetical protein